MMKASIDLCKTILVITTILMMAGCGKISARKVGAADQSQAAATTASSAATGDALSATDAQEGLALVQSALTNNAITEDNLPTIIAFLKAADPSFNLSTLFGTENKDLADQLTAKLEVASTSKSGLALTSDADCNCGGATLLDLLKHKLIAIGSVIGNNVGAVVGGVVGVADSVEDGVEQGVKTTVTGVVTGVNAGVKIEQQSIKDGANEGTAIAATGCGCDDNSAPAVGGGIGGRVGGAISGAVVGAGPAVVTAVSYGVKGAVTGVDQAVNRIVKGTLYNLGETCEQLLYTRLRVYVGVQIKIH